MVGALATSELSLYFARRFSDLCGYRACGGGLGDRVRVTGGRTDRVTGLGLGAFPVAIVAVAVYFAFLIVITVER